MAITVGTPSVARSGVSLLSSLAIPAPSGLDATMLDLVIAGTSDNLNDLTLALSNDGTAFTTVVSANMVTSGDRTGDILIARKTGAASPGNTTLSITGTYNSQGIAAARFGISGVNLTSPIDGTSSITRGTVSGNPSTPTLSVAGITTTQANCLVIAWVLARAVSDADASGFGTVSGWTKHVGFQSEFTTPAVSLGVYSKTVASAGASGALDAVLNNGGNNTDYPWHGGMIAIAPAGGGGGPTGPSGVLVNFFGL